MKTSDRQAIDNRLLQIALSKPEPLSKGMKSLVDFINVNRKVRVVEISKIVRPIGPIHSFVPKRISIVEVNFNQQ